jgi:hypothetical protein
MVVAQVVVSLLLLLLFMPNRTLRILYCLQLVLLVWLLVTIVVHKVLLLNSTPSPPPLESLHTHTHPTQSSTTLLHPTLLHPCNIFAPC